MTEVEFHTGVADPVEFACRLLRKAYRQGARALVTAPGEILMKIDRGLWVLDERDFVPHALLAQLGGHKRNIAQLTPIWLAVSLSELLEHPLWCTPDDAGSLHHELRPGVIVNVGASAPDAAAMSAAPWRWIEVVALEVEEAARGRDRWRAFKSLGLEVVHHKASPRGS